MTVARRLFLAVPVIWGSVTLLFVVFYMLPGDRVYAVVGGERAVSPEVRAHVEHQLGLDKPLIVQYGHFWGRLLHGDLGKSFVTGDPVTTILHRAAPASLRLAFWAVTIELVLGVGAGLVVAAYRRLRVVNVFATIATACVLSMPVFVAGYVLQLALGVHPYQAGWPAWLQFPVEGIGPDHWWLGVFPAPDEWRYVALPALTLALVSAAVIAWLTRSGMRTSLSSSYVLGARARGVSRPRIFFAHGVRNALIPVITFVGLDFVNLFSSAVITETVFDWPGIGSAVGDALKRQDTPVILGVTIVLGILYVCTNLVVDLAYGRLDPRVKAVT